MPQNYFNEMSRAAQRKRRLEEIEREQRREDAAALKMTEEQRETLQRSFDSVKVEFSDLDGQTWTKSILRTRSQQAHFNVLRSRVCGSDSTSPLSPNTGFAILSKRELDSFSPEETIRASGKIRHRQSILARSPSTYSTTATRSRGRRQSTRHSVLGLFSEPTKPEVGIVQGFDDVAEFLSSKSSSSSSPVIADDFLLLLELLNLTEIRPYDRSFS